MSAHLNLGGSVAAVGQTPAYHRTNLSRCLVCRVRACFDVFIFDTMNSAFLCRSSHQHMVQHALYTVQYVA